MWREQSVKEGDAMKHWITHEATTNGLAGFASEIQKTFVISVSPELAGQILSSSKGNRDIRNFWVDALAGAQRRGEWRLTHQGIAFDESGHLVDGHHRMLACIRSGVTIVVQVTVGLPESANDAIDQGVIRTLADHTGWGKRAAETLRLATSIARGTMRPTTPQVREIAFGGLGGLTDHLIEYCGTVRRYYSSAPMKLAAALTIMRGGDASFVLDQYRALCTFNFDGMTQCSKSLVRQVDSLRFNAINTRETLAVGFRVFDEKRRDIMKIRMSSEQISSFQDIARATILGSIGDGNSNMMLTKRQTITEIATPNAINCRAQKLKLRASPLGCR